MKKTLCSIVAALCCLGLLPQTTPAQTVFKTPEAAANALFAAWRAKDRKKAALAADSKAVAKLFSTKFIARRKFAGCSDESETEKNLFSCVYEDPTDNLFNVAFETIKKGKAWRVRWVTFAAEN